MAADLFKILSNRTARHLVFWMAWVFSFTFIQSFGESLHHYFAWFSYYMVTLPVFVGHTYLIAYWLIPLFARKGRYLIFVLLFLGMLIFFSALELVISNEFIFKWFPTGSELMDNYLSFSHILVSGLGNLYIVIVFLAARIIRNAYMVREEREKFHLRKLEEQFDRANRKLQPGLLLFAVDQLDRMAKDGDQATPAAIAATSDLINDLMLVSGVPQHSAEDEIRLVRKLIRLFDTFSVKVSEFGVSASADLTRIMLHPLLLFIIVEAVSRESYGKEAPAFSIGFGPADEGTKISVHCNCKKEVYGSGSVRDDLEQRLKMIGSERYVFSFTAAGDGLTIVILKKEEGM